MKKQLLNTLHRAKDYTLAVAEANIYSFNII